MSTISQHVTCLQVEVELGLDVDETRLGLSTIPYVILTASADPLTSMMVAVLRPGGPKGAPHFTDVQV